MVSVGKYTSPMDPMGLKLCAQLIRQNWIYIFGGFQNFKTKSLRKTHHIPGDSIRDILEVASNQPKSWIGTQSGPQGSLLQHYNYDYNSTYNW